MKKVSVIIPTYRRPIFLPRAIDSVLNSSYKNIEIIVVDDNTEGDEYREETERMMRDRYLGNDCVIYIKHRINRNGSAARNTGIRSAHGDYIMFLDDDDEFMPYKIQKQVDFMETCDKEYAACYTKYIDVFQNGKSRRSEEKRQGNMLAAELARNFFVHAGSNLMIRKEVAEEIGGFDESFVRNQDVEFLVRILQNYKIGFVDYVGLKVYLHSRKKVDYNELTKKFIDTFHEAIESLDKKAKEEVYKVLGLQLIRYNIGEKNFSMAMKIRNKYSISIYLLFRYYIHLFSRYVSKTAYGFKFRKNQYV